MNLDRFIDKIFDYLFLSPCSIIILLCIATLYVLNVYPVEEDASFVQFKIYCIVVAVLLIVYSILVYKYNKLPKVSKNKIGILLIVKSENKKQFDNIKSKLIDKFDDILRTTSELNFSTIYIQEEKLKKYDILDKRSAIRLMKKVNCIFFANIKVISDDIDNSERYEITINNGVLHPTYTDKTENEFSEEIASVSRFVKQTRFQKDKIIEQLEATATNLVYICKYIIGVTYYLNFQISASEKLLEELNLEIEKNKKNIIIFNYLKNVLPIRIYNIYMIKAYVFYHKYITDKEVSTLYELGNSLDIANNYVPDTYDYHINKAAFHIWLNMDIKKAKEHILQCSKIRTNCVWRYSDAFLTACESKGFLTIYKKYKQAFKIPYDLSELATFIEDILQVNPKLYYLYFALGMIYSETGDSILTENNFKKFTNLVKVKDDMKVQLDNIIRERIYECVKIVESA